MVEAIYFVVLVSTFLYHFTLHYFPPLSLFREFFLLKRLYLLIKIIFNISNNAPACQLLINRV